MYLYFPNRLIPVTMQHFFTVCSGCEKNRRRYDAAVGASRHNLAAEALGAFADIDVVVAAA